MSNGLQRFSSSGNLLTPVRLPYGVRDFFSRCEIVSSPPELFRAVSDSFAL
jgi:hypothetical protein